MRRFLLIAVVWLLAVLVLAGGLAVYLLHDEPFLKRQIGELVADQTGRSLNIDGPLEISFGRVTTLEARGIRFANPGWAQSPELFRAGRLRIGIDLPSLFSNQPRLTEIVLEYCAVALERAADGLDSWALDIAPEETGDLPDDGPGSLPFVVEHTAITNCRLGLRAPDGAETIYSVPNDILYLHVFVWRLFHVLHPNANNSVNRLFTMYLLNINSFQPLLAIYCPF